MSAENENAWGISVVFYLGTGLYIASFFLIAVDDYAGYRCALITIGAFRTMFQALFFWPGLINPLIIGFVILKLLSEAPRLRLGLAIGSVLLFIPTWLIIYNMKIKLGCAMWVVGILLVGAEDIGTWKIRLFRGMRT